MADVDITDMDLPPIDEHTTSILQTSVSPRLPPPLDQRIQPQSATAG